MSSTEPLFQGGPVWLTLSFVAIAAGILGALLILWWGVRLAGRRRAAREEIEDYNESYAEEPQARPITPPVAPPPPPLAEPPLPAPAPIPEAVTEPAPAPVPEPVAAEPEPTPLSAEPPAPPAPEPLAENPAHEPAAEIVPMPPAPTVEEAPAPEPLRDEPIAAAGPLDASPASLAADIAEPIAPAPVEPEPAPEPVAPAAAAADDLTRMKGVGPRLGEKLNSVGITSFAQLAALSPDEAEALDAKLGDFQGRIHRDRWIEQAGFLAKDDIAGFEATFGKL